MRFTDEDLDRTQRDAERELRDPRSIQTVRDLVATVRPPTPALGGDRPTDPAELLK